MAVPISPYSMVATPPMSPTTPGHRSAALLSSLPCLAHGCMFVERGEQGVVKLDLSLQEGDLQEMLREVHMLKGACEYVSATRVRRSAWQCRIGLRQDQHSW